MTRQPPIVALWQMPRGPLYSFPELASSEQAQWTTFGASPSCDLVLEDRPPLEAGDADLGPIASVHGSILRTANSIKICRHEDADIRVNNVKMAEGTAELSPRQVVRVGNVMLVACPENMRVAPEITAVTVGEMIQKGMAYLGDGAKAGRALGVGQRTFRRWHKGRSFVLPLALVALLGLGGALLWPDGSPHDNRPALPAMQPAASVPAVETSTDDSPSAERPPAPPSTTTGPVHIDESQKPTVDASADRASDRERSATRSPARDATRARTRTDEPRAQLLAPAPALQGASDGPGGSISAADGTLREAASSEPGGSFSMNTAPSETTQGGAH